MTAVKAGFSLLIAGFIATIWKLWYSTCILGNYFANANPIMSVLVILAPIALTVICVKAIHYLWTDELHERMGPWAVLLLLLPSLEGCSRATANTQTLVSDDCGRKWRLIPVGNTVPQMTMPCDMKVTVPDYPMQGATKFRASFKNRVLATIEVSYEYTIVDAIKFIDEAKYLGKVNAEAEDKSNAAQAYETAENVVIDKRIREAAAKSLLVEDIVDFSQAEYEEKLLAESNELLANKGVKLNFITFVPEPGEQTAQAIDMMTAMKIYESKGLLDLGKQAAVARAGAAKYSVQTSVAADRAPE